MTKKVPIYFIHNNFNHPPQAFGMIRAFSEVYKGGVLNSYCDFLPWTLNSIDLLEKEIEQHDKGIFLFSHYLWSESFCLELSSLVHNLAPDSITIHGGPSVPNYPKANQDYFLKYPHIDITVRGEGEVTCAELLLTLSQQPDWTNRSFLDSVLGISYRTSSESSDIMRNQDRPRVQNLDELPSPFLSGTFDPYDSSEWDAVILETNRGCPYGCTFCDWGAATKQKIRKFDLGRIYDELEWIGKKQIPIIWIADANFGIFPRDVDITKKICEVKSKYGYPKQIINNYTKNATSRLAEIIRLFNQSGIEAPGIIAVQTTDEKTLEAIDRKNIKTERYEELAEIFRKENLPMTTDLMMGLPGSTYDTFMTDIQYFIDRFVEIKAYKVQVIPNSPMADPDYIEKFQLVVDKEGYVLSSNTFTLYERDKMVRAYKIYKLFFSFGIKKYLLYFLQNELRLQAVDYIRAIIEELYEKPTQFYPYTLQLIEDYVNEKQVRFSESSWDQIYAESIRILKHKFQVEHTQGLSTVLKLQKSLMPYSGRIFPETISLDYDLKFYFEQLLSQRRMPGLEDSELTRPKLEEIKPGTLTVSDPEEICQTSGWDGTKYYDSRTYTGELSSALNPHKIGQHELKYVKTD